MTAFVPYPSWWLHNDGISEPLFDGEEQIAGGAVVARALWAASRVSTWALWASSPRAQPPAGARTHDGIRGGRLAVPTVAAFTEENPRAAARVADHLAAFVEVVALEQAAEAAMRANAYGRSAEVETVGAEVGVWAEPVPVAARAPDPPVVLAEVLPIRQRSPRPVPQPRRSAPDARRPLAQRVPEQDDPR